MLDGHCEISRDEKTVYCPPWQTISRLTHGVTTRHAFPYTGKADIFTAIRRSRAAGVMPSVPTLGADQVHGAAIYTITEPLGAWNCPENFRLDSELIAGECPATDGLVTTIPGLLLVIQTADCLPLFLVDGERRWCALAHCGWRGVRQGLAAQTLRKLLEAGSAPSAIQAWIGPCIRVDNYEVGQKLVEEFSAVFPDAPVSPDGMHLDLAGIVTYQLMQAGLKRTQILDSQEDTLAHPERYHSYRGQGEEAGRMLSFMGFDVVPGDKDHHTEQPVKKNEGSGA